MRKLLLILALPGLLLGACGKKQAGAPPEMSVKVRAAEAKVQPVEEKISLVATISANEMIDVKSEMDGRIDQINFDEGRPVEKGQLLIKLDQQKLEASVGQAEANYKLAESNRQRAEAMMKNSTISQQEYDQALSTFEIGRATLELVKQQLRDSKIYAPFSGIASARLVSPGQVINKNTPLTTLVDLDPVKVEFSVPERFLGQLQNGQAIEFNVAAYPNNTFRGEVYFIDPQVDPATRTVLVKATQPNKESQLRPGMFGNLDLILRVKDHAVVVPESCLLLEGDKTSVYIIDADSRAQPVEVRVGTRLAGEVEITQGLQGGEKVIFEGIQKVRPGAKVMADEPAVASTKPAP